MIDLSTHHLEIVLQILDQHVPHSEVRVFGSRHKGTTKSYSDLDLVIVGESKLDHKTLGDLKEAFERSTLPFRVDLLDWHTISPEFKQVIDQGYTTLKKEN